MARLWEFQMSVVSKVHATGDFSLTGLGSLASALEGRQVHGRFRRWVARVHGVHRDDRAWWIQVAREGDDTACVVLRCSHRATVEQATTALGHWQPTTALSLRVLNVMSVA